MIKILFKGIVFIILGFFLGKFLFSNRLITNNKNNCYFIGEGIYTNKDSIKDLDSKTIDYKDNKYYVYLGITKDIEVARKIQSIYKKQGINTFIDKRSINSKKLLSNIEEFDSLIKSSNDSEILLIEDIVLTIYQKNISKN